MIHILLHSPSLSVVAIARGMRCSNAGNLKARQAASWLYASQYLPAMCLTVPLELVAREGWTPAGAQPLGPLPRTQDADHAMLCLTENCWISLFAWQHLPAHTSLEWPSGGTPCPVVCVHMDPALPFRCSSGSNPASLKAPFLNPSVWRVHSSHKVWNWPKCFFISSWSVKEFIKPRALKASIFFGSKRPICALTASTRPAK